MLYTKCSSVFASLIALLVIPSVSVAEDEDVKSKGPVVEVLVWGESRAVDDSLYVSPTSILTVEDMKSINAATTEDLVKYEPSLVIRRRFIGDANGTIGMRGSNMFQTSRSMVFADGVPLHYFLQTQWSGSPRWSMVSADEISQIEVLYGPFSAEYSGNAMGGVVNIETQMPTERKFNLTGGFFSQSFDYMGFDESSLNGFKGFVSYADAFGDFSIYASYNHLENESQPQTFRMAKAASDTPGDATPAVGGLHGVNASGEEVLFIGNDGSPESATDNFKLKLGYDGKTWQGLVTLALENRNGTADSPNNYIVDADGENLWSGTFTQDGDAYNLQGGNFTVSEFDRKSFLIGARLKGALTETWDMSVDFSHFDIMQDENRSSSLNPEDPNYTAAGRVRDYGDTGWDTAEVKFSNSSFVGNEALNFVSGLRYEAYKLDITNYNSDDYQAGAKTSPNNASGGKTNIAAAYAQLGWQITENWDASLGGRYESWRATDGFYDAAPSDEDDDTAVSDDDDVLHVDRSESGVSPKFSLGYAVVDNWRVRLSVARALRFPIVEELFQNERRTSGTSIANANLLPEDGFHQNLLLEKTIENGYVRVNIFRETIDDVIFSQNTTVLDSNNQNYSVRTFIPIDEVKTQGVEFIVNQYEVAGSDLDVRFNVTYTDSEIVKNSANTDYEGKQFPRMPEWRSNLLATYHINNDWDLGGGVRYSSSSYGSADNVDLVDNVFGAHDAYTFIDLKSTYRINDNTSVSLGAENITNEIAFVHHPWPGRTLFLEGSVSF